MTRFYPRRPKKYRLIESASGHESVKSSKPRIRWEEYIQKSVVKMLLQIEDYTRKLTVLHVPNQLSGASKALRLIYAALGVRAGVPDLIIPLCGGRTLWIELKHQKPLPAPRFKKDGSPVKQRERKAKQTSEDQDDFHAVLRALGHPVYVVSAPNGAEASKQVQVILEQHGVTDFRLIHRNQDVRWDWAGARAQLFKEREGLGGGMGIDYTATILKALEICQRLGLQS